MTATSYSFQRAAWRRLKKNKGAMFGLGTAGICCWAGLRAARTPAAIPQSVTRGVVFAMVYVFGVSAVFTIGQSLWTS